ncbi:sterol carrier family protein [Rhodobacteraceae bacterium Araon29]
MSNVIAEAVAALNTKLDGTTFDGSAKFSITGEGSIIIDTNGIRAGDDETDVTLSADAETFRDILSGDLDSTSAFMSGRLLVDGDMGTAMRLGTILG